MNEPDDCRYDPNNPMNQTLCHQDKRRIRAQFIESALLDAPAGYTFLCEITAHITRTNLIMTPAGTKRELKPVSFQTKYDLYGTVKKSLHRPLSTEEEQGTA